MSDLPEWIVRGGSFRLGYTRKPWSKKKIEPRAGLWKRDELVPFGKADDGYRQKFYTCPECVAVLVPSDIPYKFVCIQCNLILDFGNGGLQGVGTGHPDARYKSDALGSQK